MVTAEEEIKTQAFMIPQREETVRIAKAHLLAIKAGKALENSGVSLACVAQLSTVLPSQFEHFFSALSFDQTLLLRNYLTTLLAFAEATGDGEVVLSSIVTDTIKLAARDSGWISFLHDLVDLDFCVKQLEAHAVAKNANSKPKLADDLRRFRLKVEQGAGEIAGCFVA